MRNIRIRCVKALPVYNIENRPYMRGDRASKDCSENDII